LHIYSARDDVDASRACWKPQPLYM
jgi:hypothetical protein